jgi:hypothetical protein
MRRTRGLARWALRLLAAFGIATLSGSAFAESSSPFDFSSVVTVEDMQRFVAEHFPQGAERAELRKTFVTEGKATLVPYPGRTDVEKYIYDINLCRLYVWRWNVSADYDAAGRLVAAFVNGKAVVPGDHPATNGKASAPAGEQTKLLHVQRPRPEADKGEASLGFILWDGDGNVQTIDDQKLMGAGPSRADPTDMGIMVVYSEAEPWRSIFDSDPARMIAPYSGACP